MTYSKFLKQKSNSEFHSDSRGLGDSRNPPFGPVRKHAGTPAPTPRSLLRKPCPKKPFRPPTPKPPSSARSPKPRSSKPHLKPQVNIAQNSLPSRSGSFSAVAWWNVASMLTGRTMRAGTAPRQKKQNLFCLPGCRGQAGFMLWSLGLGFRVWGLQIRVLESRSKDAGLRAMFLGF